MKHIVGLFFILFLLTGVTGKLVTQTVSTHRASSAHSIKTKVIQFLSNSLQDKVWLDPMSDDLGEPGFSFKINPFFWILGFGVAMSLHFLCIEQRVWRSIIDLLNRLLAAQQQPRYILLLSLKN